MGITRKPMLASPMGGLGGSSPQRYCYPLAPPHGLLPSELDAGSARSDEDGGSEAFLSPLSEVLL